MKAYLFLFFLGWINVMGKECCEFIDREYLCERDSVELKDNEIFIILTSSEDTPKAKRPYNRAQLIPNQNVELYITFYTLLAEKKECEISFIRMDHLKKNSRIKKLHKDSLVGVELIDFDQMGIIKTKEEAQNLINRLHGKLLWLIDRNEMIRDSVFLKEVGVGFMVDEFPLTK